MLVPVLIFLIGLMLAAPSVVTERWQTTVESDRYSLGNLTAQDVTIDEAASRIIQWRTLPTLFMLNPLIGIGKGQYALTHYELGYDVQVRSAHSSIISLAVEEGIVGIFFYLWLLFVLYRSSAKLFRTTRDPFEKALSFGTMSATLCLFFLDFTGTRFFSGEITAYSWILAGITLNINPAAPAVSENRYSSQRAGMTAQAVRK
jgi:O-antigen ligase